MGRTGLMCPIKKFSKGALVSLAVSASIRSPATPVFIGKGAIVRVRHLQITLLLLSDYHAVSWGCRCFALEIFQVCHKKF